MQFKQSLCEAVTLRAVNRQLQLDLARAEAKTAGDSAVREEVRELRLMAEITEARASMRLLESPSTGRAYSGKRYNVLVTRSGCKK